MINKNISDILKICLLSVILVFWSLWLQSDIDLNLADEGFLWYGATQTLAGEIPGRDFQSYDPGRYYWTAFWMMLLGKGLISLRISLGIFQMIGLTFGLLVLKPVIRSWWLLSIAGFILLCWMIPRHKIFESSISMAGVFFAYCLITSPSIRKHFISGVFVGLAAFFGRNHGLYNLLAFFSIIVLVWFKLDRNRLIEKLGAWLGGIFLGFSPMLIMILTVPGFFDSFIGSLTEILGRGSTNLPLPIPLPWKISYEHLDILLRISVFITGTFFLILPLFYGITAAVLLISKGDLLRKRAILAASTFVGTMYMHHVFARADLQHLAQGIHPLLISLLVVPSLFDLDKTKIFYSNLIMTILFLMTLFSAGLASPYYWKKSITSKSLVYYKLNDDDHLWITNGMAQLIDTVRQIDARLVPRDEGFLIAPHWPMFYSILQRKAPLWGIYFIYPDTEKNQKEMINELKAKNVNWAILGIVPMDGRKDLIFCNTHNLVWQHIKKDFEAVSVHGLPENYLLLHRKSEREEKQTSNRHNLTE